MSRLKRYPDGHILAGDPLHRGLLWCGAWLPDSLPVPERGEMTLLQNGIASSVLTLIALILCGLLWVRFAAEWQAVVLGAVLALCAEWGARRIWRWWRDGAD